jgi:hypothetical protein
MRCRFTGGAGGEGFAGGVGGPGGDGVHVHETGNALARFATVQLTGGPGGLDGSGTTPAPDGAPYVGAVEFLAVAGRELIGPSVTRAGDTSLWTIVGRRGDRVFLPSSLDPAYRFLYAALGVLSFDFPLFDPLVQVGTIDASGTLVLSITAAPLAPGQEARVLFHQLYVISAQGQRVLGGAQAEVVLDPAF